MEEKRRQLLRTFAVGSLLPLSGCGSEENSGTSTQPEGPNNTETASRSESVDTAGIEFSLDTATNGSSDAQTLTVNGVIESQAGLSEVILQVRDEKVRITPEGAKEHIVDVPFSVQGGRTYTIAVSATTTEGTQSSTTLETDHVPIVVDPLETDRLVGAHYYPWYEMHSGHENWTDRTVAEPVLGEYASDNREVVDEHLKWCLEHGVQWLSISWWGPGSGTDRALTNVIMQMERFQDMNFSILYETTGRFEEFDYDLGRDAAQQRLASDFEYLAENCFSRNNYQTIDGRPLVFFWVSNNFHGDVETAFKRASESIEYDPYILAGIPFGTGAGTYPIMDVADGVTSYNPYSSRSDIEEVFHDQYQQGLKTMHLGAETENVEFFPVVIPGFNDTGLPSDIREDNPILSASPNRYKRVCEQVSPHLAESEGVLITSFNEWYENTQIEPSKEYGKAYLELTADKLATGSSSGFDPKGMRIRFEFNKAVQPDGSSRKLSLMVGALSLYEGNTKLVTYDIGGDSDEPLFLKGAYGPESNDRYSWRWFGGAEAETTLFVETESEDVDKGVLVGQPMRSHEIEADVYVDGQRTDHLVFAERDGEMDKYEFSLTP